MAAAQSNANTASATLSSDEAKQTQDCAGKGASTPACSQDTQKVSQDQTQLTQADQQLAAAQLNAARDHDAGPGQGRLRPDQAAG